MRIVVRENQKQQKFGKVAQPPYSKIAQTLDKFKNACIYPEQADFDVKQYSEFDVAIFRLIYKPY